MSSKSDLVLCWHWLEVRNNSVLDMCHLDCLHSDLGVREGSKDSTVRDLDMCKNSVQGMKE